MIFCEICVHVSIYVFIFVSPTETCQIANARMRSSWYQYPPLVKRNALTPVPNGIIPKILSAALRHCSGRCIGLNVKGNATIDYTQDGLGKPSEKTNLDHLTSTMTVDTEFLFPVMKPEFSNDEYKFITLVSPSSAVVVEGKPLENLTGKNITSGISSLFTIMVVFVLFCFAAGCLIWIAVSNSIVLLMLSPVLAYDPYVQELGGGTMQGKAKAWDTMLRDRATCQASKLLEGKEI